MPTTRGTERGSKKRYAGAGGARADGGVAGRGAAASRRSAPTSAGRRSRETRAARAAASGVRRRARRGVASRRSVGRCSAAGEPPRRRARVPEAPDGVSSRRTSRAPAPLAACARRADAPQGEWQVGKPIEYVMTTSGPELASERRSPIDHAHYRGKQLAPACDVVLPFVGSSFEKIAGSQQTLF